MIDEAQGFLKRLETCMKDRGVSRNALSAISGININTINGYWKYDRYPRGDDLVRVACALETSCDFLVTGQHRNPPRRDSLTEEIAGFIERLDEKEKLQVYGAMKMLLYLKLTEKTEISV